MRVLSRQQRQGYQDGGANRDRYIQLHEGDQLPDYLGVPINPNHAGDRNQ